MLSQNQIAWISSAIQTFVATFLTVIGSSLSTGVIQWSWAFWGAIALTAVRAGIKAIFQKM